MRPPTARVDVSGPPSASEELLQNCRNCKRHDCEHLWKVEDETIIKAGWIEVWTMGGSYEDASGPLLLCRRRSNLDSAPIECLISSPWGYITYLINQ